MLDDTFDKDEFLNGEFDENEFNAAIEEFEKAQKSKGRDLEEDEPEEDELEEDEFDEDEYDEENMEKSIEDHLLEDVGTSAAMDVAPFLNELVQAIDKSIAGMGERLERVERMTLESAKLSKSMNDRIEEIGGFPVPRKSVTSLRKSSRFADEAPYMGDVLIKSRTWLRDQKINLVEAGNIETRLNKGILGRVGDPLDSKVLRLIKEESK